eukprot:9170641-Pyramimonas_sp.AAC.1
MQKKDIIPCLGSHASNKRLQESCPSSCGTVRTCARHLGSRHHVRGSSATELEFRIRAIHAGWSVIGLSWHERGLRRLKRELFLGKVVESGVTGLEAFALSPTECQNIDSTIVMHLRVLMR